MGLFKFLLSLLYRSYAMTMVNEQKKTFQNVIPAKFGNDKIEPNLVLSTNNIRSYNTMIVFELILNQGEIQINEMAK